ncbi:gliding motility-associated C-terminal domain-containing protein, partial [Flavobacteriaceae bacterium]|nr:gliding motility-associated C-terminal domain-containing protein [Flavobacteriaceae bacterium]
IYLITQADIDTGSVTNTATVTGVTSTGVVVSDISDDDILTQDDPTITPLCNLAVIALIKTAILGDENGDGCIDLGETIIYDFVVTNLGNVPLTQVIVTDPMVTVQGGPVTILAGESDTESFFAIYTVTQDDVENGQISNQAIAEGLDPSGNVVNDLSDDNSNFENDSTVSILCQDPSIFLEKEGVFNDENNSGFADVGETISYYFTVTNTGNLILFNITVEDPLPGLVVQGGPIPLLEPGQIDATTFTATYIITQADIDLQRVVNQATVRSVTANNIAVIDTSDDPTNLTNSDPDSDGDPDDPTITPLPSVGGQFEIFNAISADENGENDFFFVSGISDWPDNTVQIFNRWGVKVFETSGYGGSNDQENVFRGYSDGRQTVAPETLLPTGTYYYIITFNGPDNPGKNSYAGYLYLNR